MTTMSRLRTTLAVGVALATALWACASVPAPREEVARAEQAVARAEQENASVHAPLALRKAQDQLEHAREAMREERNTEARRAAERAQVEADLALASTRRASAQALVDELSRTTDALEEETR